MVQSKLLAKYTNLRHNFGDKNDSSNLENLGIKQKDIITTEQIHGKRIVFLEDGQKLLIENADGLVTDKPLNLGIRTADCLPIFFYDEDTQVVAAIHAGWQGLYMGIIKNAISKMKKLEADPKNIKVAIGPHIQICCYKVSKERVKKFQITNNSDRSHLLSDNLFSEQRKKLWYLDLGKVALHQLVSFGVKQSNIEISDICTSCNINFWSFRRDKNKSGRMLNIIGTVG